MLRRLFFFAMSLCFAMPALAQGRFELQPFAGYKFGGNIPVECNFCPSDINFIKLDILESMNYGVTFGLNATDNVGLEFMWSRQPTQVQGRLATGLNPRKVDLDLDQFHGNLVFTFRDVEAKLRPFAFGGVGTTRFAGPKQTDFRLSFAVGGGVKYFFNQHMGVRLQARYAPTYLYSTADGAWCDWYGFCYISENGHYLQQFDLTGGWIFRF